MAGALGLLHPRLWCPYYSGWECGSPFHCGGTGWAPELGSSPRHYLQMNGSVSASQAPPGCNPVRTGKTSGAPRDSDLALDFPGLGDGRQVTRRHHHGPVGRRSSRHIHTGLPPSPPPLQGPVTVEAQVQVPVSFRQWTVLPCTPLQASPTLPVSSPLSLGSQGREGQQVLLGDQ